jgi:hypothetical protein
MPRTCGTQAGVTCPARCTEDHGCARRRSDASGRQHPSASPSIGPRCTSNSGLWRGSRLVRPDELPGPSDLDVRPRMIEVDLLDGARVRVDDLAGLASPRGVVER